MTGPGPEGYNHAEKIRKKEETVMQIVVLDAKTLKVEELDLSPWRALGTLSLYDRTDPLLVPQRLRGADVVLTNKVRLTAQALKGATALKMIGVLATGYDVVDVGAARELGIPVCNVPGYATGAVTESVFGFLLEMTRRHPTGGLDRLSGVLLVGQHAPRPGGADAGHRRLRGHWVPGGRRGPGLRHAGPGLCPP